MSNKKADVSETPAANGAFDEMDLYDDEDEEDEPWEE